TVNAIGVTFDGSGTRAVFAVSGNVTANAGSEWLFRNCQFIDSRTNDIFFDATSSTGNVLTLQECLIQEDKSRTAGGAPAVVINNVPTTLRNCVLDLNSNSGIAESGGNTLDVVHCTIVAPGGGAVDALNLLTSLFTV